MTRDGATRQLLDPAGTVAAYSSTVAIVVAAALTGAAAAVASAAGRADAALMTAALVLFTLAGVVVIVAANPFRAPFTARAHLVAHALGVLAFGVAAWSTWGSPAFVWRDNWVAVSVGILAIAISPYRPVRELVAASTIVGVLAASVAYVKAASAGHEPALVIAVASFVAVAAFGYGAAAYTAGTLRSIERRGKRIQNAGDALARDLREGIARSVEQDRSTILERDVAPFFADVLSKPRLTSADRSRAREIADSIRRVMVADSDRTWLDGLSGFPLGSAHRTMQVADPDGLAAEMDARQRTALRTLIVALADDPDAEGLHVTLARDGDRCAGVLTAAVDAPENAVRAAFGPYFAVLRVTFASAVLEFDHPHLIVRFSYERP